MLLRKKKVWTVSERLVTPEPLYQSRRELLQAAGFGILGGVSVAPKPGTQEQANSQPRPDTRVARNAAYTLDRPLTDEQLATRYNIFDEFSLERDAVWRVARDFRTEPWSVHIGGEVLKPVTVDVSDLVRRFGVEERLYRHRCVAAWSMAVPWIGFPLEKLIDFANPRGVARYVRMVSFCRPSEAPGWYDSRRVFPYYEALSMEEATNELAFLATGIYGKDLPPQNGAPLRLVVPWKYGFKSIKSIAAFQFTREQPGTFWNELAPHRYTFESNVDPSSNEPRSQASELMLGETERRPTLPYNGYAAEVSGLYR